jgi:Ca2+-binding RTX toxin-like protein
MRLRGSILTVLALTAVILGSISGGTSVIAHVECDCSGTGADDTFQGTYKDNIICGRAGNDTIYGNDGNDIL